MSSGQQKQQVAATDSKANNNHNSSRLAADKWVVKASSGALNTSNPIREIIETMNLAENPDKKVIPLSIGDPTIFGNLKPCKEILDALQKANSSGKYYGYQMAAGMEASREAVANYHFKCTGNKVKRQDVILASGCSHAIDLSICVLAKHGQNILIPRPGFPLYKTLTSVYGVHYKQYNLIADKNWSIDLNHLESLIDDKTAAIIINNPSNPCGSVFSRKHLLQILKLADRYRLPIIADEIYDKFVFSPKDRVSINRKQALGDSTKGTNNGNGLKQPEVSRSNGRKCSIGSENKQPPAPPQVNENLMGGEGKPAPALGSDAEQDSRYSDDGSSSSSNSNSSSEYEDDECYATATSPSMNGADHEIDDNDSDELIDKLSMDHDDNSPMMSYMPFRSLSSLSKTVPILTCGGISKTCLIPGLRLGWIIINDRQNIFDCSVRDGLNRLTQRLMGPNSLVQGALPDILAHVPENFYSQTMDFIYTNAKLCYKRLRLVNGLQPHMPQGSMYFMVKFEASMFPDIDGDLDFTSKLMNEESVLVLPGKCFDFPNYFRMCLTVPTNVMDEALDRMISFCGRHQVKKAPIAIKTNGTNDTKSSVKMYTSARSGSLKDNGNICNLSETPRLKLQG